MLEHILMQVTLLHCEIVHQVNKRYPYRRMSVEALCNEGLHDKFTHTYFFVSEHLFQGHSTLCPWVQYQCQGAGVVVWVFGNLKTDDGTKQLILILSDKENLFSQY